MIGAEQRRERRIISSTTRRSTAAEEEDEDEDEQGRRKEEEEQRYEYDRPYPAIPPGRINLDVARVREELVSSSSSSSAVAIVAPPLHLQSSHHPLPLLHCCTARHLKQAKVAVLSPHLPQHPVH